MQLHEEPALILGRHSPIEIPSTDSVNNDEVDKGHGESELEVIMEAELDQRRQSSEAATTDWKPPSTRQRKQTVFDSSSHRLQE